MKLQVNHTSGISTCPVKKQYWLFPNMKAAALLERFLASRIL